MVPIQTTLPLSTVCSVTLAPATGQDAECLTEISKRAFHSDITCGAQDKGGPPGYDSPAWQRAIMKQATAYLMILVNNEIAGGAIVFAQGHGSFYLGRVFLDPAYHRQGLGLQAMELIQAYFPEARKWKLETPTWNTRTANFYQKLGFQLIKASDEDLFFEKKMG